MHVVGSMKFDAATLEGPRTVDVPAMLAQLGVPADAPILVCGSTHAGEEIILAEMSRRLRQRFPELFLILVPRHFERSREIVRELEARHIKLVRRSEINEQSKFAPGKLHCLLVNSTGELRYFYETATVVFIGKSLTAKGGQNPIEPCALGKPVVFGPNMQNFADVVDIFRRHDAVVQVRDVGELERTIRDLLLAPTLRERLGQNALKAVSENRGAVDRTVEMIIHGIKDSGVYMAPLRKQQP